ncbi:MAG: galactose oxidase-like domain-containing protein [Blastocatellia bacterium]
MRRQLSIFMLLITGTLVLSINFISPNQALLGSSTVSAASQSPPFVNLALNKPATQSSTDTVNGIFANASRAVDGSTNGNMSAGSVSQTFTEIGPWWEVDLGAIGLIDSVEVYNRTDCCSDEIIFFYLLVSDVPFVSHDLDTTRNQPEVTSNFNLLSTVGPNEIPLKQTGRYVRLHVFGNNPKPLHLAEVQVLGNPLPTNPATAGQWSRVQPDLHNTSNTLSLVHISLLPSRKLLFWGRDKGPETDPDNVDDLDGSSDAYLWDLSKVDNPSTSQDDRLTLIRNNRTNLFCSGHSFLPNGNLFVAGGSEAPIDNLGNKRFESDGHGPRDTNIFNYQNESWSPGPSMNLPRWYPSVVTLSNGETLIVTGNYVSGFNTFNRPVRALNRDTEILDRNQNLRLTPNGLPMDLPNYPFAHLGPDGNVLVVSGTDRNGLSYIPSTNNWVDSTTLDLIQSHNQGTSVMYDKGKIIVIGGVQGGDPTSDTEVININTSGSSWATASSMYFQRYYATSVLMPDGQVFIVGGSRCGGANNIRSPNLNACNNGAIMNPEIYNPGTGIWSILARQQVIRMYHSVALLLPDARILVAGGGRPGAFGENGFLGYDKYLAHREAEIFSPPYLFNSNGTPATRPVITNDELSSITYGQSFNIGIANVPASQIEKAVLVRLPSVTHALNFDQRRIVLSTPTVLNQQTLSVTAPADSNECPPGPYMLFVFRNGVPSMAKIILVDGSVSACNPSPLPPSGLVATAISNAQVNITWTASSGPVDHYELDRRQSISAPFIKIADVAPSATSYTDLNVTGSVAYLYQVRAACSSGSSSQPSNSDLATTMSFTDNPLMAGVTVVKAQHLNELRVVVNAVRATAGLPQVSWTDASLSGVSIKAVHITELRQNLNQALQAMGFAIPLYTDQTLNPGLIVKRAHVEDVRQAVR